MLGLFSLGLFDFAWILSAKNYSRLIVRISLVHQSKVLDFFLPPGLVATWPWGLVAHIWVAMGTVHVLQVIYAVKGIRINQC